MITATTRYTSDLSMIRAYHAASRDAAGTWTGDDDAHAARACTSVGRAFQDQERDAPVLRPCRLVVVAVERLGLTVALRGEPLLVDALADQVVLHGVGAAVAEVEVVGVVATLVGVALDLDELNARVALQRRRDRVEDRIRLRLDDRLVEFEVDHVEDLDRRVGDDDAAAVGTAVGVLVAVIGLRLVGALVVLVEDAVVVVVGVGAAVGVLE